MSENDPPHDPSIENEPHLRGDGFRADPSEEKAATIPSSRTEDERVEHNVWEEPGLSSALAGTPGDDAANYGRWLEKRQRETSDTFRLFVILGVVLVAGPFAIVGTFLGVFEGGFGLAGVTIFGPAIEETLKIAVVMWIVEKRPYFFRSGSQILLCGLFGGFFFAVVENFMYLNVYVPNPTDGLVVWRWTVCVALHTGCSLLASVGVAKEWNRVQESRSRAKIARALPFLIAAIVCHGAYNGFAVILSVTGYTF